MATYDSSSKKIQIPATKDYESQTVYVEAQTEGGQLAYKMLNIEVYSACTYTVSPTSVEVVIAKGQTLDIDGLLSGITRTSDWCTIDLLMISMDDPTLASGTFAELREPEDFAVYLDYLKELPENTATMAMAGTY